MHHRCRYIGPCWKLCWLEMIGMMLVDSDYLAQIYCIVEETSVYFLKEPDDNKSNHQWGLHYRIDHFIWQSGQVTIAEYLYLGLILGLRPANDRQRYKSNVVCHRLGANLESALYMMWLRGIIAELIIMRGWWALWSPIITEIGQHCS